MKYKNYFKSIIYLALGAFTLAHAKIFLIDKKTKN